MTPINVALSVYAEAPPYSVEAVQKGHFPDLDAQNLLKEGRTSSKDFFTLRSKAAACILCSEAGVPIFVEHWGDNLQFYPNFALFSTLGG